MLSKYNSIREVQVAAGSPDSDEWAERCLHQLDIMSTQDECLLLTKLPIELRDIIYELATVLMEPVLVEAKPMTTKDDCKTLGVEPGLLATCWQIRREATYLFYSKSSFRIDRASHAKLFFHQLGSGRIKILRQLYLFGYPRPRPDVNNAPREKESHLDLRKRLLCDLADEFAELGLRVNHIKICTRRSLFADILPVWSSVDELQDFRADLGRRAIEKGWGSAWECERPAETSDEA